MGLAGNQLELTQKLHQGMRLIFCPLVVGVYIVITQKSISNMINPHEATLLCGFISMCIESGLVPKRIWCEII